MARTIDRIADFDTVPIAVTDRIRGVPRPPWTGDDIRRARTIGRVRPVVDSIQDMRRRARQFEAVARAGATPVRWTLTGLPACVSHRELVTDLVVGQGGRGTCWAFAGVAALEAAYARTGVHVKLSEQYLFHISKAHENQRTGGSITSLLDAQGSSDVVHHLTHWALPDSSHISYLDRDPIDALAKAIPGTAGMVTSSGGGTQEQTDWFEYDLRNIPLMARWFAQYRVRTYDVIDATVPAIKAAIAAGHDVVLDVADKINRTPDRKPGGHCILVFGYDDATGEFEIKNSQTTPGIERMRYSGDPHFDIQPGRAYVITSVEPPATQWAAMWVGRWEMDHDGWRGRLVIRRFTDNLSANLLPGPGQDISLGTWYGEDGTVRPVEGHFDHGGQELHATIGGQPFELFIHGTDPYRAAGRCWWNGIQFGAVLSRGTIVGAGSGVDRLELIGRWDVVEDGGRMQLTVGADPQLVGSESQLDLPITLADGGPQAHVLDADVDVTFGLGMHLHLLHHTREDTVMGGIATVGSTERAVEARMSANLYTIERDGTLHWYRHTGRSKLAFEWDAPRQVGTGWADVPTVFGGGDGVVYAIDHDGTLLWYYHDGRNQGTGDWRGRTTVGSGWSDFTQVFAGDGGVIYAVTRSGDLLWYRHLGRRDGTARWLGPRKVGVGWGGFTMLAAGPDGVIYGVQPDGTLLWYRHFGFDQGDAIWHGPLRVGHGWNGFDQIWTAGNGYLYARTAQTIDVGRTLGGGGNGDRGGVLYQYRHHGFLRGDDRWAGGAVVGTGWGYPQIRGVIVT